MDHPLDRPIWTALTTRQTYLAQKAGGVLRYAPAFATDRYAPSGVTEPIVGPV